MKKRITAVFLILCMLSAASCAKKPDDAAETDVDDGYTVESAVIKDGPAGANAAEPKAAADSGTPDKGSGRQIAGSDAADKGKTAKSPAQVNESVNKDVETAAQDGGGATGTVSQTETEYDAETSVKSDMAYKTTVTNENAWVIDCETGSSEEWSGAGDQIRNPPGVLTAGEWNDNRDYDSYLKVIKENKWDGNATGWGMNMSKRLAIELLSGGSPAENVKVELFSKDELLYTAVTNNEGIAYLFYDFYFRSNRPEKLIIGGNKEYEVSDEDLTNGKKQIEYSASNKYKKLDLMFTTDTTGSMEDELGFIQKEFKDVISRAASSNVGLDIRVSVNFYRDFGDEYIVRSFPFDGDADKVQKQLSAQSAAGGGDTPEALDKALDDSINGHEWRNDSVKLMFLTLDAPGHKDDQNAVETIRKCTMNAAAKGIRIIPIMCSGNERDTELLLRAIASATGGTYAFLTDHSGVGNKHLAPTVGQYEVEKLNDLMVRVINEYCK